MEATIADAIAALIDVEGLDAMQRRVIAHGIVGIAESTSRHWVANNLRDSDPEDSPPRPPGSPGPVCAASVTPNARLVPAWLERSRIQVASMAAHRVRPMSTHDDLRALADEYWEDQMRANPFFATFLGDHRFDDQVDDLSVEAEAARRARARPAARADRCDRSPAAWPRPTG